MNAMVLKFFVGTKKMCMLHEPAGFWSGFWEAVKRQCPVSRLGGPGRTNASKVNWSGSRGKALPPLQLRSADRLHRRGEGLAIPPPPVNRGREGLKLQQRKSSRPTAALPFDRPSPCAVPIIPCVPPGPCDKISILMVLC